MNSPIERVRYYDGEYLRAFDFAADQAYHVNMRRRLNMALHLYGIVEGLQLKDTSDPSTGISQVSVTSGMAIDPFGREIFLLAPYTFDDVADVNANRITVSQLYEVWIQYVRVADTPPSVGYAACDTTAQNTRWLETFKIVLLNKATPKHPPPPQVTDDISEDETPDPDTSNGVFLGRIHAAPGSTKGVFSLKDASGNTIHQPTLTYVGLRAQSIQPPDYPDTTSPAVSILSPSDPLVPPLGVEVLSDLFCEQNLIVGQDFLVSPAPNPPTPPPFPSPTGNLKVASDLFLQGNLYSDVSGAWLNLAQLIAALVPDVLVGSKEVFTPGTLPTVDHGTYIFSVSSSRLSSVGSANVSVAVATFQTNTQSILAQILGPGDQVSVQVTPLKPNPGGSNTFDVSVNWSVTPSGNDAAGFFSIGIVELTISYVVICYPG